MASELIPIPESFLQDEQSAHQSQAAFLLILRFLAYREEVYEDFRKIEKPLPLSELDSLEDIQELGVPESLFRLQEIDKTTTWGMNYIEELLQKEGVDISELREIDERNRALLVGEYQHHFTNLLIESPTYLGLAKLAVISTFHPASIVCISAASLCFEVRIREDAFYLGNLLLKGVDDEDLLVREVAATVLARLAPNHGRLAEMTASRRGDGEAESSDTSTIIHGTWARNADWWQPGGNFHDYILNSVDPSLYSGNDRFEWSGGYSDQARALGAFDLIDWISQHNWDSPDLFTHSHGGSVVMLASRVVHIKKLVLLSCPVHRKKYWPNSKRIDRVISVRVHLDLVILADFGGQRFRDPDIEEHVLPIWFDHSETHNPNTWKVYDVPDMIR